MFWRFGGYANISAIDQLLEKQDVTVEELLDESDLIQELKHEYTIVIVTHNMQQAARVSDKTAFFNIAGTGKPGKLIELDDTSRIFTNPTEKATEDYITGRFG